MHRYILRIEKKNILQVVGIIASQYGYVYRYVSRDSQEFDVPKMQLHNNDIDAAISEALSSYRRTCKLPYQLVK